ncbi:hypothetical protein D3C71_1264860 [compost metagenome]
MARCGQTGGRTGRDDAGHEQVPRRLGLQEAARALCRVGGAGRAGDAQVLSRVQDQLAVALRQPRLAYGQIRAGLNAQGAVGDCLAVQLRARSARQDDIFFARDSASGKQLAAGLRVQQLTGLQDACAAQRQVASADHLERADVGQQGSVHAQVAACADLRGLTGDDQAGQRPGARIGRGRTVGLQARRG